MSANNYKAAAVISIELDAIPSAGKSMVCATLVFQPGARPMHSFSGAFTDAQIVSRLPEWLAELRAEVALGRFESLAEERARLAAQSSPGNGCTDMTSLNATCTSLGASA